MNSMKIKTRGKVNLILDVLGKRDDGYHEVEMILQSIDLYDVMEFTLKKSGITLHCNHKWVPEDERNIVYKIAKLLQEEYDIKQGIEITIHKNIPVSAGLAGGSSNAAGTLKVLNRLWKLNLSLEKLMEHGRKIGADVPFCLLGGTALARGIGEILQPLPALPPVWLVLVKPPIPVSTARVYQNLILKEDTEHPQTQRVLQGIKEGNIGKIIPHLYNMLEGVSGTAHPEIVRIKRRLQNLGAKGVLMSGSGPTIFGICKNREQAQFIYKKMRRTYKETFVVQSYNKEERAV